MHTGRKIRDELVKEVIESCDAHIKKYGFRTTTVKELDARCRGK